MTWLGWMWDFQWEAEDNKKQRSERVLSPVGGCLAKWSKHVRIWVSLIRDSWVLWSCWCWVGCYHLGCCCLDGWCSWTLVGIEGLPNEWPLARYQMACGTMVSLFQCVEFCISWVGNANNLRELVAIGRYWCWWHSEGLVHGGCGMVHTSIKMQTGFAMDFLWLSLNFSCTHTTIYLHVYGYKRKVHIWIKVMARNKPLVVWRVLVFLCRLKYPIYWHGETEAISGSTTHMGCKIFYALNKNFLLWPQ